MPKLVRPGTTFWQSRVGLQGWLVALAILLALSGLGISSASSQTAPTIAERADHPAPASPSFSPTVSSQPRVNLPTRTDWFNQTPRFSAETLESVSCLSTGRCVAVGKGQDILLYDGTGWKKIISPTPDVDLYGVSCLSVGSCLIVGERGTILSSTDQLNWTVVASGTTNTLYDITCRDSGFCAIAGDTVILTSSNRTNWTIVDAQALNSNNFVSVFRISCVSTGGLCVTGGSPVFYSTDGVTWALDRTFPPVSTSVNEVSCRSNGVCLAGDGAGHFYTSTDANIWSIASTINLPAGAGGFNYLNCTNDPTGPCILLSQDGIIRRSMDTGRNWTTITGPVAHSLNGASCRTTGLCRIVGDSGLMLNSQDSGVTWSNESASLNSTFLQAITCRSGGNCTVVGDAGLILTSRAGGDWTPVTSPVGADLYGVACRSNGYCVAVGAGGTLITTNGGSWQSLTSNTTQPLNSVTCANLAGYCVAAGKNGTIISTNNGTNWQPLTSNLTTQQLSGVSCLADASLCVAVGYNGTILRNQNRTGWNVVNASNIANLVDLRGISCYSGGCVAAGVQIASPYAGAIATSPDGATWTVKYISLPSYTFGFTSVGCSTDGVNCTATGINLIATNVNGPNPVSGSWPGSWYSISCTTDTICRAVGYQGTIAANYPTVYNTADNGGQYLNSLSWALAKKSAGSPVYVLPPGGTLTLGYTLNTLAAGTKLVGPCGPNGPATTINGNGNTSLTLPGGVSLSGLRIIGFTGNQVKPQLSLQNNTGAGPNQLSCVKVR